MQPYKKLFSLFLCLLLCVGIGWIGGIFTQSSIAIWYPTLIKAPWTPPNWTFPVVWTILYLMMGVSLWLVLIAPSHHKTNAVIIFGIQLLFNFIWSWLFFYMENPFLGMVDIMLLWIAIVATIKVFSTHSRLAAYLLVPYLIWVTYAFTLNLFIWIYN